MNSTLLIEDENIFLILLRQERTVIMVELPLFSFVIFQRTDKKHLKIWRLF